MQAINNQGDIVTGRYSDDFEVLDFDTEQEARKTI